MGGRPKLSVEDFVARANEIHDHKFSYTKVQWKGTQQKVCITCPVHGDFEQLVKAHLLGKGCKRCACTEINARLRTSVVDTRKKLRALHPHLRFPDLHNVYTNKVKFVCKYHGEGEMKLGYLLEGKTCKRCADEQRGKEQALTTEEFIRRAKKKFPELDYTKVVYKNAHTLVQVKCPVHGYFYRKAWTILRGAACKKCRSDHKTITINRKVFYTDSRAEGNALKLLVKNGFKVSEIRDRSSGEVPTIYGKFDRMRKYLPDFFVPHKNLVIEVKTPNSLGIKGNFYREKKEILVRRMQKRALAVKAEGYRFDLMVMSGADRLKLPRNWVSMKASDLIALFDQTA